MLESGARERYWGAILGGGEERIAPAERDDRIERMTDPARTRARWLRSKVRSGHSNLLDWTIFITSS